MDTVTATGRRGELRAKLEAAIGAMHRAASASVLKGDPLAEQLHALAESIGALGEIYESSADTQLEIAEKLRTQADTVANDAIERVHASGVGIIDQLAPRLAVMVEKSTRTRLQTARLRVILGGAAGLVIGLALIAGVSYAAGFASGRSQGEISAHTISAAMAAGPGAASAWATLMADNDPVQALTACKKSVAADAQGRRYCSMPVWLDPATKAVPGQ
ncbi:hypothetical protein [Acidocella sp.]|uniref:hypothetical protein n=1 Tax=Acidocella sp. TaxID=50710 RepID=UPI00261C60EA|nr:hypothetical protein [Acidocella sp.]MDD2794636.1 hypothetical protein [Acidocella sp.]